ncbi:hypothetical protein ACFQ51_26145 [Streptomyces kaempferi]
MHGRPFAGVSEGWCSGTAPRRVAGSPSARGRYVTDGVQGALGHTRTMYAPQYAAASSR